MAARVHFSSPIISSGVKKYTLGGKTSRLLYKLAGGAVADNRFIMLVKSDNAGTSGTAQFTIPTTGGGYLYDIETSDGFTATGITGDTTITFPTGAGTHEVRITGDFPKILFNNVGDKLKVLEVTNWGTYGITQPDQTGAFSGCLNLSEIASGGAWFNVVTNGTGMFPNCNLSALPIGMELPLLTNAIAMFNNSPVTSLPASMTLSALTNGFRMFIRCNLTSLPSGMTLASLTNGNEMFQSNSLTSLPSGMTLASLTNGSSMFRHNSLTSLPLGMEFPALTSGNTMFQSCNLTDLPTTITLPALTNGSSMFAGNTINTTRYSQLLVDMESGNPNNNVPFHGGSSKYNATGETARNILTGATRLWTITDGGLE